MSIKEQALQFLALETELSELVYRAYNKALQAGVVTAETRDEDDNYVFLPTKKSYTYKSHDVNSKGFHVIAQVYCGGGDYDYTAVNIPFEAFDDFDAWIATEKATIAQAATEREAKKKAQAEQDQIEQEQAEKDHYLELKQKYEGTPHE